MSDATQPVAPALTGAALAVFQANARDSQKDYEAKRRAWRQIWEGSRPEAETHG